MTRVEFLMVACALHDSIKMSVEAFFRQRGVNLDADKAFGSTGFDMEQFTKELLFTADVYPEINDQ